MRRHTRAMTILLALIGLILPSTAQAATPLPGMPPVTNPSDIYAADHPNMLSPTVAHFPARVYVPNTMSNTVTVIDPSTYKVIATVKVGREPQHVVPSWDLKTLWVNNDLGNSLTPINPATGKFGKPVKVHDPYNLYFTPDGKYAVVMASADHQLVFRDAHKMKIKKAVKVPCNGVNHADWSADGRTFVVSCEFGGELILVDTAAMKVRGYVKIPRNHLDKTKMGAGPQVQEGPMPQDVKISPDGSTYYIADMMSSGLWIMSADPKLFGKLKYLKTGRGAHGLYVTRDSKFLLITNRGEGSISVLRFSDKKLIAKWRIPGGGSPDMGQISADGKVFWVSGRYNSVVYALSTVNGKLLAKIRVGRGPHGLTVYPVPGRYSLGHTGIMR